MLKISKTKYLLVLIFVLYPLILYSGIEVGFSALAAFKGVYSVKSFKIIDKDLNNAIAKKSPERSFSNISKITIDDYKIVLRYKNGDKVDVYYDKVYSTLDGYFSNGDPIIKFTIYFRNYISSAWLVRSESTSKIITFTICEGEIDDDELKDIVSFTCERIK